MLILFCEKCGKRIPQTVLDARGIKAAVPEQFYYCPECESEPPAPVEQVAAPTDNQSQRPATGARAVRPTSGFAQAVRSAPSAKIKKPVTGQMLPRDTSRLQRSHSSVPTVSAPSMNTRGKVIIGVSCGVMILAGILIFSLNNSGDTKKNVADAGMRISEQTKKEARIEAPVPPSVPAPVITTTVATPRPIESAQPPQSVQPAPTQIKKEEVAPDNAKTATAPRELTPKEEYDLKVKQGLMKPTPPPPSATDLTAMTDPDALRTKLLEMNSGWPHEAVRHLGELPAPAMDPKTVWAANFKQLHSDYNSKVTPGTFEGEAGAKAEGGDQSRVACYDNMEFPVNHTHIKLRVFQKGLKKMRFSSQTRFGERFNLDFDAPPEGKWTDLDIDFSKAVCGDVKFANQPIKHTEVHGFRSAENNGAYFILSKFEVINGEQK